MSTTLAGRFFTTEPSGKPKQLYAAATAAKLLQSCPTLCDPIDGSPQGSTVLGNLQARTLERVAISFSRAKLGKEQIKLRLFTDDMIINEENPKGSIKILKLVITARLQDSRSTYRSQLLLGLPRPHD